jgi:S-adenosylmethionine:diacylglycerol 3-amino-3-carboxypropyl transferase
MSGLPEWVQAAREVPLVFSQVREDALQDVHLVRRLTAARGRPQRVLMVASGGCTACALAAEGLASLTLVDPNPVQLDLCRLKLHLLETRDPSDRLALLGHTPHPARGAALGLATDELGLDSDRFGDPADLERLGLDNQGRYERVFAALRAALAPQRAALEALLALTEPAAQAARVAPGTSLGEALQAAFREVFALANLVALFGEGATANRVQDFAEHFTERTRRVLAELPAATNPYLWQVLLGRYPPRTPSPWLGLPRAARLPEVRWVNAPMNVALRDQPGSFDLVHLSNILDWLDPRAARETLALAANRLAPGGLVVIRQLNSALDVRAAAPDQLAWEDTAALHAGDRSYFYRALHVGQADQASANPNLSPSAASPI